MATTKPNSDIFIRYLIWRIFIFLVALIAVAVLPIRTGFTFLSQTDHARNLFQMWTNFDGVHYITLAIYGYGIAGLSNMLYAFFPVYPWLVRTVELLVHNFTNSGVIISNVSFLLSLFILYKLFRLDYKDRISRLAVLLILIFPTSFFFGAVYSESFFLLLSVSVFYFARKKQFFLAGLFCCSRFCHQNYGDLPLASSLCRVLFSQQKKYSENAKSKLGLVVFASFGVVSLYALPKYSQRFPNFLYH